MWKNKHDLNWIFFFEQFQNGLSKGKNIQGPARTGTKTQPKEQGSGSRLTNQKKNYKPKKTKDKNSPKTAKEKKLKPKQAGLKKRWRKQTEEDKKTWASSLDLSNHRSLTKPRLGSWNFKTSRDSLHGPRMLQDHEEKLETLGTRRTFEQQRKLTTSIYLEHN